MRKFVPYSRTPMIVVIIVTASFGLLGFGVWRIVPLFLLFGTAVFLCVRTLVQLPGSFPAVASNLASVIVVLVGISALIAYGGQLQNQLRFLAWSLARHGQVAVLARQDGVLQHWDGWGIAGMENDSYLVSDPNDSIAGLEAADRWARDHRLGCEIVATQRVWRAFYILTTYNCAF